ncbi:RnfH family protein [Alkalilimnicola ehrlichii]|nr:RnfH family protein [Alkalilimnicola ehrlichii]
MAASSGRATCVIEVAYARPDEQLVLQLSVEEGVSVAEAIDRSGILARFPEIDLVHNKVGIFGRLVALDEPLRDRDRVEIYRPLLADPKEVRKQRAKRMAEQKNR